MAWGRVSAMLATSWWLAASAILAAGQDATVNAPAIYTEQDFGQAGTTGRYPSVCF